MVGSRIIFLFSVFFFSFLLAYVARIVRQDKFQFFFEQEEDKPIKEAIVLQRISVIIENEVGSIEEGPRPFPP